MKSHIRVLRVDDLPIIREGIRDETTRFAEERNLRKRLAELERT